LRRRAAENFGDACLLVVIGVELGVESGAQRTARVVELVVPLL
jgi:hypothetical protein